MAPRTRPRALASRPRCLLHGKRESQRDVIGCDVFAVTIIEIRPYRGAAMGSVTLCERGSVATTDSKTNWIVAPEREDAGRFIVHRDEKLRAFMELESAIRTCRELSGKLDVAAWRHSVTEVFMSLWISGSAQRSTFHVGLVASSFEPPFVVEVAVLSRKSRPKPAREDTRPYSYKSLITHHLF